MKFQIFRALTLSILLITSNIVSAGLITDTNNDTFIDNTSGLEWMDFGINNQYSFNQVKGLLTTTYLGWELANQDQVLAMYDNAFGVDSQALPDGSPYFRYGYRSKTFLLDTFDKMGYAFKSSYWSAAYGWFLNDESKLSYFDFQVFAQAALTEVYGTKNNPDEDIDTVKPYYSTMLVRTFSTQDDVTQDVPEPSTLAIFALGMIGLASRRFKNQS